MRNAIFGTTNIGTETEKNSQDQNVASERNISQSLVSLETSVKSLAKKKRVRFGSFYCYQQRSTDVSN